MPVALRCFSARPLASTTIPPARKLAVVVLSVALLTALVLGDALARPIRTEIVPGRVMTQRAPDGSVRTIPPTAASSEVWVLAHAAVTEAQMAQAAAAEGGQVLRHRSGTRRYVVSLPAGMSVTEGVSLWKRRPEVQAVTPNYIMLPALVPNDPRYGEQWQWPNTNAPAAWDVTTGSSQIVVAVVDSGVQMFDDGTQVPHPDLVAKAWTNPGEIPNNGQDDDGNGYVDDVNGWDCYYNNNNPNPNADGVDNNGDGYPDDGTAHGTHCAGLVGALANNAQGGCGYDWNCRIMAVQVFGDDGGSTYDIIAEGIDYAANNGADVISLSIQGPYSEIMNDPIQNAVNNNALPVVASGNYSIVFTDDQGTWFSPVCNDGPNFGDNWVMGVGSVGDDDTVAYYSNLDGSSHQFVDVMSTGGDVIFNREVLSTVPYIPQFGFTTYYGYMQGTSMACPVAAGLASLVRNRFPAMTPAQIINQIRMACDNIDAENPQYVGLMGAGRINGGNSVVDTPPKPPRSASAFDTPGDEGGSATVAWSKSPDDGRGANDVIGYDVERTQIGMDGPFSVVKSLPKGSTTYVDTDVTDGTSYWYRIRVRDSVGSSVSRVAGPAIPRDDTPPEQVTTLNAEDYPADEGGSVTLYWNGYVPPSDFSHYNVYRAETAFASTKDSGVVLLGSIASSSRQYFWDQSTEDGVEYWYAVTCVDDTRDTVAPNGNEDPDVETAGPVVSSPNFTFSFPPGVSIVSIGADTHQTDLATLFNIPPAQLQAAWWDPVAGIYHRYADNPNDPALRHQLGKAFWLSTANPISLNVSGQPAPSGDFSIPFSAGWNLLGNPYTTDCEMAGTTVTVAGETKSLGDAARANWTRDYMWGYDPFLRSYVLISPTIQADFVDTAIRRGRGVFFRAFTSGTLTLPRPADAAEPVETLARSDAAADGWSVQLVAESAAGADVANYVGVSSRAAALNTITSPPIQGVDLYFEQADDVHSAAAFAAPGATELTCKVVVACEHAGPVSVSWPDLSALPRDLRPILVDVATGKSVYLRTTARYTYQAEANSLRQFRLEIKPAGAASLVVSSLSAAPAPGGVQAVFSLSRDAAATVDVINLAGRQIRTLLSAAPVSANAVTTVAWDGRSALGTRAPAGRYLIRVTAAAEDGQAVSAARAVTLRR